MNGPLLRKPAWDGVSVGIGIVVLAGLMGWQTILIPTEAVYAQVGPSVVPWIVTAVLALLGGAIILEALLGHWTLDAGPTEWQFKSLIWVSLGLFLNIVMIGTCGFILASTVLFVCTARAFGSVRLLRDAGIGFTVALLAYVAFDRVLGYQIGTGFIENLL